MNDTEQIKFKLSCFSSPGNYRGRSGFFVLLWWFCQATIFAWSPQPMYGFRRFLLRLFGADIGVGVLIRPSAKIVYPWKLHIGDHSWIGDDASLYCLDKIVIGSNTVISQKCYLSSGSHDYKKSSFDLVLSPVVIGDSCWLATDVFLAPGVHVVSNTVVGARSSVFKSIDEPGIYFGSPAQRKVE